MDYDEIEGLKLFQSYLVGPRMFLYSDSFDRFTAPALNLKSHFDVIVNSYTEGQLKTENDGESFLKYLKGSIIDAILIEDSQKSCDVFTQLGGTALQVTRENPAIYYLQSLHAACSVVV
jgi:hypothetical protein